MPAEIKINCGAAKVAALPYGGTIGAPWSQAMVDAVWRAMYGMDVTPQVPKTLLGWYSIATRGPRMFALTPRGKDGSLRGPTKEEAKFLNFWGQAVNDPCRKQSGISKIAGGILQVASVFFPVMGYFQAAQTAVNTVQDVKRQKELVKDATDILTSSAQQIAAANNPAPVTALAMTQPTAPPLVAPAAFNPPAFADPLAPAPRTTAPARAKYTPRDYAIAAGLGVGLYLLIRRIRTR